MINKQRVKRIRSAIYTVIVILVFLPLIMLIALCIVLISSMGELKGSMDRIETALTEPAHESGVSDSREPQVSGQSFVPGPVEKGPEDAKEASDEEEEGQESGDAETAGPAGEATVTRPNAYSPDSYPEIYFDTVAVPGSMGRDTIYLTIDNTPSSNFHEILAVLDRHDVKATFFVWWGDSGATPTTGSDYRAIVDAGHSIGIHAGAPSVPLSRLYSGTDVFMSEFSGIFTTIEQETGVRTRFYRLPGGGASPRNAARQQRLREIRDEMDARGFLQYDWNASAQDAVNPPLSMQQILANLNTTIEKGDRIVALVHDGTGSDSTVKALDAFIADCLENGYAFQALDYDTVPVSFLKR